MNRNRWLTASRIAMVVAVIIAGAPSLVRADGIVLDLETCVAQATANSDVIYAARFREEAASARAGSAGAARWPTLGTIGAYDYASEVAKIDIPIGPTPRSIEFGDGTTWRFGVGVDVPIYTGGALGATAHAERAGADAAAFDVAADSLAVVRQVRATFYNALASRAQLDAARIAVRRLERHLETVEHSIDVGAASEEERVQITARLREAEQRMLAVEMQSVTDELALATAIGRPGSRVTPEGNLDVALLDVPPPDDTVASRPELSALALRRRESDDRARAAWGALLPSLVASAYMNYGKPGVDPIDNDWMSWASARVSLAWTLFDAGARSQRAEAARASARAIDATRADLHRRFEGAFETAKVRLDYARRQSAKAAQRLEAEQRRLDLVTGRRDQGMATETELLDAHDDLADAEAAAVRARAAVRLAESELLYAAGR